MKGKSKINFSMCALGVLPVLMTVALIALLIGLPLDSEIRVADLVARIGVVFVALGTATFTSVSFCRRRRWRE